MQAKPKVCFIGGFLGAGKTTAIKELAKVFAHKGLKSAAITNDQAEGLVDTYFLTDSGVPSEEVAGSCFCCNFDGLADALTQSISKAAPDVILAEPVGSCTDIVATVIRPMRSLMKEKVEVLAYSVLVEPERWIELGSNAKSAPWSMQYLFDKQMLEADFIVLTKLDTLTEERAREMQDEIVRSYPDAQVVGISSKSGIALDTWMDLVQSTEPGERWLQEIDYDKYAKAEAEMGWLNASLTVTYPEPQDGENIVADMADALMNGVRDARGNIGHLKLLGVAREGSLKVGYTRVGGEAEADGTFNGPLTEIEITVNMRATVSPGDLSALLNRTFERLQQSDRATVDLAYLNTFRPAPPKPTHRYGR